MNGAYLHLAINHIPVVAMPICFLVLVTGALRKSHDLIQAGFAMLVLTALITIPVWKTGGPAAHTLFRYPGATVERSAIHEHAEAAEYGLVGSGILGVIALFGLWLSRRPEGAPTLLVGMVILGSLFVSTIFARVAHLGGEIRHPEIESGAPPASSTMMMAPGQKAQ